MMVIKMQKNVNLGLMFIIMALMIIVTVLSIMIHHDIMNGKELLNEMEKELRILEKELKETKSDLDSLVNKKDALEDYVNNGG